MYHGDRPSAAARAPSSARSSRSPARVRVFPAREPSDDHHAPAHGAVRACRRRSRRHPSNPPRAGRARRSSRAGRAAGRRLARRRDHHHGAPDDRHGAVLDRVLAGRLRPSGRAHPAVHLDHLGRSQGRLGAAHRHAHRRDAGGGDDRLRARAPLFDRLHGRGPVPAAVLRLPVALHLRHAGAGDRRQPRADVLRLGGRRPRELSADRLLVSQARGQRRRDQGLRRQPRRRFRLRARHLRRVHDDAVDRLRHHLRPGAVARPARPSTSSAGTPTR